MRKRTLFAAVVIVGLAAQQSAFAQFPFGGGGGFSDPASMFQRMARERSYFLISETRMMREPLTEWAKKNGVTDDKITKDMFMAAWPTVSESMKSRFGGGFGGAGGFRSFGSSSTPSPSSSTTPASPASSAPATSSSSTATDAKSPAEVEFKRRDDNSDGKLNRDEMSFSLRADLEKWDTNKDGLIELSEFVPYFQARQQREQGESKQSNSATTVTIITEDNLDSRPVVYRVGKLPKELPAWFVELDIDVDGQVSLYEWRKPRKEFEEFRKYDRNDDGFLTVEEVLRYQNSPPPTAAVAAPAATNSGDGGRSGFGGFGRPGGFGGSRFGGFGPKRD